MVLRAKMVAQSRTVDSLSKAPCVSISKMAIWKTDHQQEHIMHLVFLSSVLATNHVNGRSGYYCSFTKVTRISLSLLLCFTHTHTHTHTSPKGRGIMQDVQILTLMLVTGVSTWSITLQVLQQGLLP